MVCLTYKQNTYEIPFFQFNKIGHVVRQRTKYSPARKSDIIKIVFTHVQRIKRKTFERLQLSNNETGPRSRQRVLSFFSVVRIGTPTNLAGECAPPPLVRGEGYTLTCGRGCGGGCQFGRGDRHCGTLGKEVLCGLVHERLHSDFN
jgi:hypothetical protein